MVFNIAKSDLNLKKMFNTAPATTPTSTITTTKPNDSHAPPPRRLSLSDITIGEQALDNLEDSSKAWESEFNRWGSEWRAMLGELSFERALQAVRSTQLTTVDERLDSMITTPESSISFCWSTSSREHIIDLHDDDSETQSLDSTHAEYVNSYQHFANRGSKLTFDMDHDAPSPVTAQSISIVENSPPVEPPAKHGSSTPHAYHHLLV